MLTKDLLRFRRSGKYIKPLFIAVDDDKLLRLAGELLQIYTAAEQQCQTRRQIADQIEPMLSGWPDQKLIRGLNKLILDRCDFSIHAAVDYGALRQQTLALAAKIFRESENISEATALVAAVKEADPALDEFIRGGIYADLPENEVLMKLRRLYPQELLQRYNVALVQSLLLYSERLELLVTEPDAAKLRKMFKYLKFFRLLAQVTDDRSGGKYRLKIMIDGPAAILTNSRKYGLQLASFFPAVCDLRQWNMKSDIQLLSQPLRLNLSESAALVSHYRNFSAYVPEEIVMFHRLFKQQITDWEIIGDAPFIKPNGREVIFPDLSFRSASGLVVQLELFHRWHSTPLLQRLEQLQYGLNVPLLIGVDRALYRQPEIKQQLDCSEYFSRYGFLFRDFPGVARVYKLLQLSEKEME